MGVGVGVAVAGVVTGAGTVAVAVAVAVLRTPRSTMDANMDEPARSWHDGAVRSRLVSVVLTVVLCACGDGSVGSGRGDAGPADGGGASDAGALADSGAAHDSGSLDAAGAGDAGDDAGASADLCTPVAGSLVDGTFESGMDGLAPAGWQVRDPGAPDRCTGSGAPSEHVYLTDAPPGCGGHALAIDARGEWDCYAVQFFTDYSTIEPGRTYRVSAVVRSERQDNPAAWFTVGVQWLNGSDGVFGDEKNPMTAELDYDWKLLAFDLVAPADARRAVVWLTAHYPGLVAYDNVSIAPLP